MAYSQFSNNNGVHKSIPQLDLSDMNTEMRKLQPILQQIPLSSHAFQQAMKAVLQYLQVDNKSLALGCGMNSEFRFLPEIWGLPELQIVHSRYLTPSSYHLYSALGAAEILATGRGRYAHFPLLIGCSLAILRIWNSFPHAIANLRHAVDPRSASAIDEAEQALVQMVPSTQQALAICREVVDPKIWDASVRASELAREVRGRVAKSMGQGVY